MRKHHKIKCETEYYQAVENGDKMFELRLNDRNYQVGDMVTLIEIAHNNETGRQLPPKEIKYILKGGVYGLPIDWIIFNW